jgi:hypothetical protein
LSESDKLDTTRYDVFCGLDVGKSEHHACALATDGTKVHDKPLPNDEPALVAVFTALQTRGQVLVIVDQPASIGALAIAVARSLAVDVAYLPGLAMRRIADLYPGEGKTDARDAFVIADAARTMPHTLRRVGTDDETLAGLGVLAGYDDDLAAQSTRLTNRLRACSRVTSSPRVRHQRCAAVWLFFSTTPFRFPLLGRQTSTWAP